jgi:hypothetical protein
MFKTDFLSLLNQLRLEFWLPLPLLGLLFWYGGDAVTQWQLQQSRNPVTPLTFNTPSTEPIPLLKGRAKIRRQQNLTWVELVVLNPVPRTLEYYLPLMEVAAIETEIARRLNLSPAEIHGRLHYEVVD